MPNWAHGHMGMPNRVPCMPDVPELLRAKGPDWGMAAPSRSKHPAKPKPERGPNVLGLESVKLGSRWADPECGVMPRS